MTTPTLFVAFSHTLTQSQIDGFKLQYGKHLGNAYCPYDDPQWYEANIVTLGEVAPELQQQMSNIPATATLAEIQELAKKIVAEAVKAGATHFFLTGEPTLTMWANLYASQWEQKLQEKKYFLTMDDCEWENYLEEVQDSGRMTCIQSTTKRQSVEVTNPDGTVTKTAVFSHVQWREMF